MRTKPTRRGDRQHNGPRSSIMNLGRRVDYAVRALCYLAAQAPNRVVPRAEIQLRQRIPPHFLSKILRVLVNAGFLTSVPGARGGFRLERSARDISIRAVYEAVEGQLSLVECVDHREGFCCFAGVCTQIDVWSGAQQVLGAYLEKISIGDIADRHGLVPRLRSNSPHDESPGDEPRRDELRFAKSRRGTAPDGWGTVPKGAAPKVA